MRHLHTGSQAGTSTGFRGPRERRLAPVPNRSWTKSNAAASWKPIRSPARWRSENTCRWGNRSRSAKTATACCQWWLTQGNGWSERPKYSRRIPSSSRSADLPVRREYASSSGPSPVIAATSAGLNPAQRQGKRSCCRTGSDGLPDVTVQFAVQLQSQPQQIGAGRAEPQSRPIGHGLEQEVLEEPALFGPAPLDAPGNAGAGVPGQSDGVLAMAGSARRRARPATASRSRRALRRPARGQDSPNRPTAGGVGCGGVGRQIAAAIGPAARVAEWRSSFESPEKGERNNNGDRLRPGPAAEPIGLQPSVLGRQGFATMPKWPKGWAMNR